MKNWIKNHYKYKGKDANGEFAEFYIKDIQALIDQKEKEQKERFKKIVEDNLKVFNKEGLVAINNSLNNI